MNEGVIGRVSFYEKLCPVQRQSRISGRGYPPKPDPAPLDEAVPPLGRFVLDETQATWAGGAPPPPALFCVNQ